MKNVSISILILCILSSCASTQLVHLSVLEPAAVTLPPYIKNVIVVNRTRVAKKNRLFDVADKVLSAEGANLDKEGAQSTMVGLTDELKKNNRFGEVTMLTNTNLYTDVPGIFPTPLPWDTVKKYCDENNADALFALELFDTQSKIDYSVNKTTIKTPLGSIPALEQQANMHTLVKAGWRIYDADGKNILDEAAMAKTLTYYGKGINPLLAAQALISRKEAVKEVGNIAGQMYAFSIIPLWIRVSRDYYVRGNDNFKMAMRKARTGNWNDAEKLWMLETTNSKGKIAGRACYNMAIISEINGDVDMAIKWAQQSYENYNNHLALQYVNILKNRKTDDDILAVQQAGNQ